MSSAPWHIVWIRLSLLSRAALEEGITQSWLVSLVARASVFCGNEVIFQWYSLRVTWGWIQWVVSWNNVGQRWNVLRAKTGWWLLNLKWRVWHFGKCAFSFCVCAFCQELGEKIDTTRLQPADYELSLALQLERARLAYKVTKSRVHYYNVMPPHKGTTCHFYISFFFVWIKQTR